MKSIMNGMVRAALTILALPLVSWCGICAPPLTQCLKIEQDTAGKILQNSFVWADLPGGKPGVSIGFRRAFNLSAIPRSARLRLFADARYVLWVNGSYADRGPARFQPNGPEYDTVDITRFLKRGRNAVALLVAGWDAESGPVL